ncbi:hypothetical protein LSH36_401g03019 [Paralvinella palmiformis]|uniref:RING-type domain-containing protein n=1 Tax=Paralvinella palmiformis TaxID=53620 RepID=A0AAD9JCG8_9ANNE|nr:hypothetical protein LSH36_401g03019 [Paralvinella palmiformis]
MLACHDGRPWLSRVPLAARLDVNVDEKLVLFRRVMAGFGWVGCKIKALRAKTNTYIKTPVRGEEPVFVVTGRKEDVAQAKREILSAAEHFSQIRASRRNNNPSSGAPGLLPGPGNPNLPGQVTIQVRVPYRVVGLVVGPKGATIKRIQQQTHTYIVTPNRDKEPIFEVTGLPENVEKARQEIEGHIAMRTGGLGDSNLNNHINNLHSSMGNLNAMHGGGGSKNGPGLDDGRSDFQANGIDAGFHELTSNIMFGSLYNGKSQSSSSAFTPYNKVLNNNHSNNLLSQHLTVDGCPVTHDSQVFPFSTHLDSSLSKFSDMTVMTERLTGGSVGLYDSDEGIGGSPTFDSTTLPLPPASIWSDLSSDSQGSDFGTLFTGIQGTATAGQHHLGLNSSPCVSLPQLSFSKLVPSSISTELPSHVQNQAAIVNRNNTGLTASMATDEECVRRLNNDPLSTTLALLQNVSSMANSLRSTSATETSTLASASTSVCSSLSLSESSTSSSLHSGSSSSSPTEPAVANGLLAPPPRGRHCMVCGDGDIVAALVPCGHNMFCMECANKLVHGNNNEGRCPICQQTPTQAIRIFS